MFHLLAQLPTPTPDIPGTDGWGAIVDPRNWIAIFKELGFGGSMFLIGALVVSFLTWRVLVWTVAKDGWARKIFDDMSAAKVSLIQTLETSVVTISKAVDTQAKNIEEQTNYCEAIHVPGGPCHLGDVREAGCEFAKLAKKMGDKAGIDLSLHTDRIQEVLRHAAPVCGLAVFGQTDVGKSERDVGDVQAERPAIVGGELGVHG